MDGQQTIQGLELEQMVVVCFELMKRGATFEARENCSRERGPWVVILTGGY